MPDEHSAARPERQTLDVIVLRRVLRSPVHGQGRRLGLANRQPADLPRRRHVGLDEGRGNTQRAGDVVEAVRRIVRRQELRGIDLEIEQVANHVRVLGAIEAVEAGWRHMDGGISIELVLEPADQRLVGGRIRPPRTRRRHHAGPKFSHDLFPDSRVVADMGDVERVQHQVRRLQALVVAAHTGTD